MEEESEGAWERDNRGREIGEREGGRGMNGGVRWKRREMEMEGV